MNLKEKSGIYVYTFPNGKKYVGQSLNLQDRLKAYRADVRGTGKNPNRLVILAIRKYGWNNIKIEYPFIIDRPKVDETDLSIILDVLELRYIKEYNCIKPNGYNLTSGADGTLFSPCESTEVVLKNMNRELSKPILIYDLEGNFVSEYTSIADCAYRLHLDESEVRKYANCRKYMRGMYMVKFKKDDIVPMSIIPYKIKYKEIIKTIVKEVEVIKEKPVGSWKCHSKPILQYDIEGNFIKEWESITAAQKHLGQNITLTAKQSLGFQWRVKTDNYPINIGSVVIFDIKKRIRYSRSRKIELPVEAYKTKYSYGIIQYDLEGNELGRFESIADASEKTRIRYGRIYGILNGTIKNPDYLWKVAG